MVSRARSLDALAAFRRSVAARCAAILRNLFICASASDKSVSFSYARIKSSY